MFLILHNYTQHWVLKYLINSSSADTLFLSCHSSAEQFSDQTQQPQLLVKVETMRRNSLKHHQQFKMFCLALKRQKQDGASAYG